MIHYEDDTVTLLHGDALEVSRTLDSGSVQAIVTSPPYYSLRDYGVEGQYGLEDSPAAFVDALAAVFAELLRVVADDGTLWVNLGDSYYSGNGSPTQPDAKRGGRRGFVRPLDKSGQPWARKKNLLGIPWRVAFALQDLGWNLRNDIIWHKPNVMHEPTTDRFYSSHEHLFLFSKSKVYSFYGDRSADVWSVPLESFAGGHMAVMPSEVARRAIVSGTVSGDVVLDPFSGSGTTGMVATQEGRRYIGIDLSADYLDLSLRTRFAQPTLGIAVS